MKEVMEKLFETEKQEWLKKSYEDLKKLYDEHDLYSYAIKANDQEYGANVLMLEIEEDYMHPCLTCMIVKKELDSLAFLTLLTIAQSIGLFIEMEE